MKEAPAEIPKGIPTVDLTCQLCEYVSPVMASFEGLFYLDHVQESITTVAVGDDWTKQRTVDEKVHHYVRAVRQNPTV